MAYWAGYAISHRSVPHICHSKGKRMEEAKSESETAHCYVESIHILPRKLTMLMLVLHKVATEMSLRQ